MGCSQFDPETEQKLVNYFTKMGNVDGIICISAMDHLLPMGNFNIPMVVISQTDVSFDNIDWIKVDDRGGICNAIDHFVRLGHRRIAYIGEKLTYSRLDYYKEALQTNNIEIEESLIKVSSHRFERAGYESMLALIDEKNLPTAVFAAYDDIALGAIRALHEHSLRIPQDISLVGVDDIVSSSYLKERLTTISCHIDEQVEIALDLLLKKIYNPQFKAVQNITIKTEFIQRDTVGAPKAD
jgi:DNA-binding LacI/PurR family transcriptional regulator